MLIHYHAHWFGTLTRSGKTITTPVDVLYSHCSSLPLLLPLFCFVHRRVDICMYIYIYICMCVCKSNTVDLMQHLIAAFISLVDMVALFLRFCAF